MIQERGPIRRLLEKVATGYTAANTAFAGGGIPNQDIMPPAIIRHAESPWAKSSPLDPIVLEASQAQELQETYVDIGVFYNAIDSFVDTSLEPGFWKEMKEKIARNPDEYLVVIENTLGHNIFPNEHFYEYYPNRVSNTEVSFPSVEVLIADPDGYEYMSSVIKVRLQLGADGTLKSYISDENLIPIEDPLPPEKLEKLCGNYFIEPSEMTPLPWEVELGIFLEDPAIVSRDFEDQEGTFYFQGATGHGHMTFELELPIPPGFQTQESESNFPPKDLPVS